MAISVLADSSADVVLTDVASVRSSLEQNIQLNVCAFVSRIHAAVLDWLAPGTLAALHPPFDIIVAADVVWVEDLIAPLVHVLDELSSASTLLYLAHQTRSQRSDELLFSLLSRRWTWYVRHDVAHRLTPHRQRVDSAEQPAAYRSSKISIFTMRRK
jgi:predicted nicotinamide N-methyase